MLFQLNFFRKPKKLKLNLNLFYLLKKLLNFQTKKNDS
jgi:hypothetical protein